MPADFAQAWAIAVPQILHRSNGADDDHAPAPRGELEERIAPHVEALCDVIRKEIGGRFGSSIRSK